MLDPGTQSAIHDTRSTKDDTSSGSHLREEVLMFFSVKEVLNPVDLLRRGRGLVGEEPLRFWYELTQS